MTISQCGTSLRAVTFLATATLVGPASAAAQLSPRTSLRIVATIPAPQGLSASYDAAGVRLGWQQVGEAAQYLVMRAPDPASPAIQVAAVPAGSAGFQDRGFFAAAAYHVIALAADGRRGTSPVVSYVPPATLAIDKTQLSGTTRTSLTTLAPSPTYQPPGAYAPPVGAAVRSWNPALHQVTWNTDGVHGYAYWQVYKLDPASPTGRLVRDRLPYREYWDSSFVAANTTSYRIVGYATDGTWGSADVAYPNPPQPAAPAPFGGVQVSTGAVKLSWQTLPGAIRYRLFGATLPVAGLPVGGGGVSNVPATHVLTGLPVGRQSFSVAAEYNAGVAATRASTTVDVRATSGNYRVTLKTILATRESSDDPLSMDGRGDEIYAAAYWVTLPFYHGNALNSAVVQTLVYGDANQAPTRIQAGTASPSGGIRTGNVIPDGMAPIVQPSVQAFPDRLPLLVWQGTLQDSGQILVVHPTVWESDRNPTGNFPRWVEWWSTPNGRGGLKDKAYPEAKAAKVPIIPTWLGYMDGGNFPIQPGMDPAQGQDRPIGIGGFVLQGLGEGYISPNSNSLTPYGLVLTRERIERALGPNVNAILVPVTYKDKGNQGAVITEYTVFVQLERMP